MSWKKNAFSCLLWLLYLFMTGTALLFFGRVVCDAFGVAACFGVVIPAVYLLITGVIVFLLHRKAAGLSADFRRIGKSLAWIERILVLVLILAGIFLRVIEVLPDTYTTPVGSAFLESAYVSADGQGIPPFSHGAFYLYMWVLRLCFLLLGNKAEMAVWLQIALQISGVLMLFFAVRKMAGRIPAGITLSFFMLSPYMVRKSLELSPGMLYLLLFSFVLLVLSRGVGSVAGWGFWLLTGILVSVVCYLDVAGFLLAPLTLGVIVMRRKDAESRIIRGLSGALIGFLAGFGGSLIMNGAISGKPVSEILGEWVELYRWKEIRFSPMSSGLDMVWPVMAILCFMAWGIFSFWCERETERFTVWIFCLSIAILMQCLGIFTEEMDGVVYILFFSAVLAGLGIRESMMVHVQDAEEENGRLEEKETTESRDNILDAGKSKDSVEEKAVEATEGENREAERQPEKRKIEFLENPLPLPKKHEKRVMDYKLDPGQDLGGYDVAVADDDDFDH